jgi:hypothetical protein
MGRWKVEVRFAGDEEHAIRFEAQAEGKGAFLLLDTVSSLIPPAEPTKAQWEHATSDEVTFSGAIEFPIAVRHQSVVDRWSSVLFPVHTLVLNQQHFAAPAAELHASMMRSCRSAPTNWCSAVLIFCSAVSSRRFSSSLVSRRSASSRIVSSGTIESGTVESVHDRECQDSEGTTRSIKAPWVRSVGSSMPEGEQARSLEPLTVHSDRSASTGSSSDARLAAGTAAKKAVSSRQPIGITMLNASVGCTSCSNPFTKPDR